MYKGLSTCLAYSCCPGSGGQGRALPQTCPCSGCPGPQRERVDTGRAESTGVERAAGRARDHSHSCVHKWGRPPHHQRKWNSALTLMELALFADAKSENLVIRPRMGRQTPPRNGINRDLLSIMRGGLGSGGYEFCLAQSISDFLSHAG